MKCPYCEEKINSIVEERTPLIVYILCFASFMLLGYLGFLLFPCLAGVFRRLTHRCPKCLNEIREDFLFSSLDDEIISLQIGTFGILIKRKTFLNILLVFLAGIVAFMVWETVVDGPSWYLER